MPNNFVLLVEKTLTLDEFETELEKAANGVEVDVKKHFLDRIKERNISQEEIITMFRKFVGKYSSRLTTDKKVRVTGVIKDILTKLNIAVDWDNKGTATPKDDIISLVTIMRKENFIPSKPTDKVFNV